MASQSDNFDTHLLLDKLCRDRNGNSNLKVQIKFDLSIEKFELNCIRLSYQILVSELPSGRVTKAECRNCQARVLSVECRVAESPRLNARAAEPSSQGRVPS